MGLLELFGSDEIVGGQAPSLQGNRRGAFGQPKKLSEQSWSTTLQQTPEVASQDSGNERRASKFSLKGPVSLLLHGGTDRLEDPMRGTT